MEPGDPIRVVVGIGLLIGLIGLYFVPTLIARQKEHVVGVFVVNLLFGWTVIGWLAAFIWAFAGKEPAAYICPRCREGVDRRAVVCPHCRSEMRPVSRHGVPFAQSAPPV